MVYAVSYGEDPGPPYLIFTYLQEEKEEFMYLKKIRSEKLSISTAKTYFQEMDFKRKVLLSEGRDQEVS